MSVPALKSAAQGASAVSARRRRLTLSMERREWLAGYLFVAPDALGLLTFVAAPAFLALALGTFQVDGFGGYQFVGLGNYRRMLADPLFLQSLRVTAIYVVALVPCLYVVGLALALAVQRPSLASSVFRSLFFMPQMVSLVVVALVWQVLLVDKIGLLTRAAAFLGLGHISWFGDPTFSLAVIVFISVWFLMGFYMLIFLGGLQDIPREFYDAAKIDGAGPIACFFHITLPLLQPTSFFILLVSTVTAVCGSQTFDLIYVTTKGGPANSTSLTTFYIYQTAFEFGDYGYAAAMASVLIVILMALTFVLFLITRGGRFHYA